MPKYRKKPVVIEAEQWRPGRFVEGVCVTRFGLQCLPDPHVHTIHNNQAVALVDGDWIAPEPDGVHYYPIKPDIFAATYEAAE